MVRDDAGADDLFRRHQAVLPAWMPLYYELPMEIVAGAGCVVTDGEGTEYLDFYSGIATNILGYGVREVREAVQRQLCTGIVHTSTFYLIRAQVEVAERIGRLSGIPDPVVFFTCSGTEAVETALLLATQYRDSHQIISLRYAYHGRSFGALGVTGDRMWQGRGLSPLRVAHVRGGGRRRGELGSLDDTAYVRVCAEELEETITTSTPGRTAAMIVEPVQGVAGAVPLVPGQLGAYKEVLDRHDVPLIVDEVQTGWGRTGQFWGHQWHEVTPDLMVFAKGGGNGLSMGGVVGRREIMSCLPVPSLSSFGGNPLAMAAVRATIDYIETHALPAHAARVGDLLIEELRRNLANEPWVREVRGAGLLMAVEYAQPGSPAQPAPQMAEAVQEACRRRGLLVGLGGTFHDCARIMPPLTLSAEQAREGARRVAAATKDAREN
ncbi:aspartate aminotransferase family protein [Streptomyces alfalfae]|uniref:alanine--glyoxylate transaminase n=1 Tax=Streptomyces alfalfae TaxID=1642299 RepID=A0A7T4U0P6_9ACTN|nr:aminotransferase class III-fold pyridoxal phosphate-dependent enzyme [Streptomyces alfalfae]QQC92405.1 aminotransferase class III-fold pyridoxal phosphate-dependent enzyme [Streptomyces alfalfae]